MRILTQAWIKYGAYHKEKTRRCRAFIFYIRDSQMTIKVERLMSGRRSDKRLNIVAMLLRMFGHLLFLRRHHGLLFHVSISTGVM